MVTEEVRVEVLGQLQSWLKVLEESGDADKPMAACVCGQCPNGVITPRSVVRDVENRTEEGESFLESWVDLHERKVL